MFGRTIAAQIFNKVASEEFINDFKDTLTLDSEGIPTFDSLMKLSIVKDFIGEETILKGLNKGMPVVENTAENIGSLNKLAQDINKQDSEHIALVEENKDGKLTIVIKNKTEETIQQAESQRKISELTQFAIESLGGVGVTVGLLSEIEKAVGIVGETNFDHLAEVLGDAAAVIRVANNMEGFKAIGEEFCHLLVRANKHKPFIQRAIRFLSNEKAAREVLGEEYDIYSQRYQGNEESIAEEAVGKMLRDLFLDKQNEKTKKTPIFKRAFEYIKSLFKGKNPAYIEDSITRIKNDLGVMALNFLDNKMTLTKEDLKNIRENTKKKESFYALVGKAKQLAEGLKKIVENSARVKNFTRNTSSGSEVLSETFNANDVKEIVDRNLDLDDTMGAIAEIIQNSIEDILHQYDEVVSIDDKSAADKQIIMRNALTKIQSFKSALDILYSILSKDFLNDEGVLGLHCMIADAADVLSDFRTVTPIEAIDTSNMSSEEIAELMQAEAHEFKLSNNKKYYIRKMPDGSKRKYLRVTKTIESDRFGVVFDENSPFKTPSTNIGTGTDELTRDFLGGKLRWDDNTKHWYKGDKPIGLIYPNATQEKLDSFVGLLYNFKKELQERGITLLTRDITVEGTVSTVDANGVTHTVRVAGTLDVLGYDAEGNWYVFDMKTHRSLDISESTKQKYAKQLTLYARFLEEKYGIKVKEITVIPIKVSYPMPAGTKTGTAKYEVDPTIPEGYEGVEGNLLIMNGSPFKAANPFLETPFLVPRKDVEIVYSKLAEDPMSGARDKKEFILDALKTANDAYSLLKQEWDTRAFDLFALFLKSYVGDKVKIYDKKTKSLKEVPIEEAIHLSLFDVGMMERYLDNAANSSNTLLKVINVAIKDAKENKRLRVIAFSKEFLAFAQKYEELGIKNYDFMFESDKARYINKLIINGKDYSYDMSAYNEAYKAKIEELNKKYGEFPEVGTEEYSNKHQELMLWVKENKEWVSILGRRKLIPRHDLYPSSYSKLSDTQKTFYDEFMTYKESLDELLPKGSTFLENTIKLRKTNIERAKALVKKGDFKGLLLLIKTNFVRDYTDEMTYKGKIGLNNEEVLTVPIYFVKNQGSHEDLTTDVISSLLAYADMAINFDEMENIAPALEMGRQVIRDLHKVIKTSGGRRLTSILKLGGQNVELTGLIPIEQTKLWALLNDLFEMLLYGRMLNDNGTTFLDVDINKFGRTMLKVGSTVLLGMNVLAHAATLFTGLAMVNIEAFCGQYFSKRDLLKADRTFMSWLGEYVGNIGKRIDNSKLGLIDEMFNIDQRGTQSIKRKNWLNRNVLLRIFGPHILFFGQDAADFYLKNRVALARMESYDMIVVDEDGNTIRHISLLDAIDKRPIDKANPQRGYELFIPDNIRKPDGSVFLLGVGSMDVKTLSNQIGEINRNLFGIYNEEDKVPLRKTLVGNFLLLYRDWMFPQYRYRFGKALHNYSTGEDMEGYYRTGWNFLGEVKREMMHGHLKLKEIYRQLPEYKKQNIKRLRTELLQYGALIAILAMFGGGKSKDKDRTFIEKWIYALMLREKQELGALIPFFAPKELINVFKSPMANVTIVLDYWNLLKVLWVPNWFDEIESGDYEGHSTAYKAIIESPLTRQYKNIRKIFEPERMIRYYESLN